MRKRIRIIKPFLALTLLSSCALISETKIDGRDFNEESIYKIKKNITTKEEVLSMLDDPYIWSANNKIEEWTYQYNSIIEKKTFLGLIFFYNISSKDRSFGKKAVLLFDSAGVVQNINYTEIGELKRDFKKK